MSKLSFTKLSAALIASVLLSACDNSSDNQKASQAGAIEQSKVEQTTPVETQKDTQNTEGTTGSTETALVQETAPTPAHNHAAPEITTAQTQETAPEASADTGAEGSEQ